MDTIAAIATPHAVSAVGIVRLSGEEAISIAEKVFFPKNGKPLSAHPFRQMVLGTICDGDGNVLDEALAVAFPKGGSYTGEPSVELHCHGSPVVLQETLHALFLHGARQATGGEFTKRAFLSGNLDLTQAEAVIDLIEAETADAARNAAGQVGGSLRRKIDPIFDSLMEALSRFYAVVDYPDDDIEELETPQLKAALVAAEEQLTALSATVERGQVLKNGVVTAIIGRPNVGKSSLLNALAGFERAIVTDIAGTTRDTVEEKVLVGGVLLRLLDTAGLRETSDTVEQIGVERSREAAQKARLCLVVLDSSKTLTDEDEEAIEMAKAAPYALGIFNKTDLGGSLSLSLPFPTVSVSAKTGEGMAALEEAIRALFPLAAPPSGEMVTNPRQKAAISRGLAAIHRAMEALECGLTPDAILTDAEEALSAIGELNGKKVREDLVSTIFSRFCVGK